MLLKNKPAETKKKKPVSPNEVFFGILLGAVTGCVPLFSILEAALVFLLLILRTNITCTVIFFAAGKGLAMYYYPDFVDTCGLYILTGNETMVDFSRWFTQLPVITYLNFTNSMVMGGYALGIATGLPLALIGRAAVSLCNRKAPTEEKTKLEKKNNAPASPFKK